MDKTNKPDGTKIDNSADKMNVADKKPEKGLTEPKTEIKPLVALSVSEKDKLDLKRVQNQTSERLTTSSEKTSFMNNNPAKLGGNLTIAAENQAKVRESAGTRLVAGKLEVNSLEPQAVKKQIDDITRNDNLLKSKRGIAETGNLIKTSSNGKKHNIASLTQSNQNFRTANTSSKLTPPQKQISPSLYSLKIHPTTDVFSANKNGVSQSYSTTEVNRIILANSKTMRDADFANQSLASIAMGSTDGKKLFIRRVPTSPSELLNLNNNGQLLHVTSSNSGGGATTSISDELSTTSSYSSLSETGSQFKPRKRDHWTSKVQFILACVGYSIGIGNLWRFPYLCYQSGGGVFLVPYFIILLLCGIPILYMELAVGQFTRRGPIGVLSKLCPIFKGAGISAVIISFFMSSYYNVIIAYCLYYFSTSFRSQLPWQHCGNRWNTQHCWTPPSMDADDSGGVALVQNLAKPNQSKTPSEEFYNHKVLQLSSGIDQMGDFRWELVACSFVSWILVYFALWKSVRSSGRVLYFTATIPFVLIFVFLMFSLTLDGSEIGLRYFFMPDFELLYDHKVWVNAGAQIFNSIGIAYGAVITFSSYNKYNNQIIVDTIVVSVINTITSILIGVFIFIVIGNITFEQETSIEDVIVDGPGLIFVVYPQAMAKLPFPNFWAVLFFFSLLCLALNSQFALVEVVVTSIQDGFPRWIKRHLVCHEIVVLVVCIVSFLCGLPYVTQGGIYFFQLVDHYTATTAIMYVAFFEVIAIAWIYGSDRLARNVHHMTGKFPSLYFRFCWSIASPLLILAIWIFSLVDYEPPSFNNGQYIFPRWAEVTGWIINSICVVAIPITAILVVANTQGKTIGEKLRTSFKCRLSSRVNSEDIYNKELKNLIQDKIPVAQIVIQPAGTNTRGNKV
uniref:Transporter n=1 Tax=Cacopsylla melanoneura TaxID=428564 RepID=A0A8D9BQ06_9HEMI